MFHGVIQKIMSHVFYWDTLYDHLAVTLMLAKHWENMLMESQIFPVTAMNIHVWYAIIVIGFIKAYTVYS